MLDNIVVVSKPTRLEELRKRHATDAQVKFYLESRGESFSFYRQEHDTYQEQLSATVAAIPRGTRCKRLDRALLPTYQFADNDLVVAVGDDGIFVNLAKYVGTQPVIVVNPDPAHCSAVLASCTVSGFGSLLASTLRGQATLETLTMVEAKLEDGQVMYGLNDIFIGRRTHVSSRYEIEYRGERERQSSSGIIVATGTGSTAWLSSKAAEVKAYGGSFPDVPYPRTADHLVFAVREPYPSVATGVNIVHGKITRKQPLKITSQIPEGGVMYSDGMEDDYVEFTAGKVATVFPSEKRVTRVLGNDRACAQPRATNGTSQRAA